MFLLPLDQMNQWMYQTLLPSRVFSDCSVHLFSHDVRILHFYWNGSWTHSPPTAPSHFPFFFAVCIDRTHTHNAGLFSSPIVSCPRPSLLGHLTSFLPPMLPHAACPLAFPKVFPNNLLRLCVLFPHAGPRRPILLPHRVLHTISHWSGCCPWLIPGRIRYRSIPGRILFFYYFDRPLLSDHIQGK